jgi:hypothetical protein
MAGFEYYGTELDCAGHYRMEVQGDQLGWKHLNQRELPFNPDLLPENPKYYGSCGYYQIGGYSIIAIAGSCYDRRPGCCSVFYIKADMTAKQLYDLIMTTEITKKIISQMPFNVIWSNCVNLD